MTTETAAKLPVWKTALDCYRVTFRHMGDLLRYAWPWLLLLIAVSAALYWGLYPAEKEALTKSWAGSNTLWVLTFLVSTVIGAAIAVPWHRLLLLGERQSLADGMRLDSLRWLYLVRALPLALVPAVPLLAAMTVFPSGPASAETEPMTEAEIASLIAAISGLLLFLLLCFISTRLALVLPATALGHDDVGWSAAWAITGGNTWRLFWVSLILLVPLVIVTIFVVPTVPAAPPGAITIAEADILTQRISFTMWSVISEALGIVMGMLFVTFLSLAYRHFRGLPEPENIGATATAP